MALFDAIGVGQWFRYVTGAIEVWLGRAAPGAFTGAVRRAFARAHNGRRHRDPSLYRWGFSGARNPFADRICRNRMGTSRRARTRSVETGVENQDVKDSHACVPRISFFEADRMTGLNLS